MMNTAQRESLQTIMLCRTVVVVDMVGYSSVAKLLEENISAVSVSDLNNQIQDFIVRALEELHDRDTFGVVAKTGDGIIIQFEKADDAHSFALAIHSLAAKHNEHRSEASAERRFRVGISTGEISKTVCGDSVAEYAGTAIANAARLEAAAKAGQIIIDVHTFERLCPTYKTRYGREQTVKGKRTERFRVHKHPTMFSTTSVSQISALGVSRRSLILMLGGFSTATAAAAWFGWPRIQSWIHPLPSKRYVAVMIWPRPNNSTASIVNTILDSISARLIHAEADVKDLLIISPSDIEDHTGPPASPKQAVSSLGANLVLAASLSDTEPGITLILQVLDALTEQVLRYKRISLPMDRISQLADMASLSSLELLGLPSQANTFQDADELRTASPKIFATFSEAEALSEQANDDGLDLAITKYQDVLSTDPHFALGYAKLAIAYVRQYVLEGKPAQLALATNNAKLAISYNPASAMALLCVALTYLYSGKTEQSQSYFARALIADPGNPEILLYKAQALRDLNDWPGARAVYEQILKKRPNYWPAYNELGWVLSRQALYKQAADIFETAATSAHTVALPLANLSTMYMELGNNDDARKQALLSLHIHPIPEAYLNLGDISFTEADYRKALDYYQKAGAIAPKYHLVWRNIGDCYAMLGPPMKVKENYEKAAACLSDYLSINPRRGASWMTLAFYHAKIGQIVQSREDIEKAEAQGATQMDSRFLKVQALALLGDRKEALTLLVSCIDEGLSPYEVKAALDLNDLRNDPLYLSHVAAVERRNNQKKT